MCGIAGVVVAPESHRHEELLSVAAAMSEPLVPRGPDGSGQWVDEEAGAALAHTRLAVIDLSSTGEQPMVSADRRWVLSANAEIYNHRDLARRLTAEGVRFRGHCDVEVLGEAVSRWGLDTTLDRIDGMFAFALWDRLERELSLVRDRLGEKPLCWTELPKGGLAFGSTLDALTAHPQVSPSVNAQALASFLRYSAVPAPGSIYENVMKLEPATVLQFRHNEAPRLRTYWTAPRSGVPVTPKSPMGTDTVSRVATLLEASVADRLVADVPVGVFLSGGVDSTTIAAMASRVSQSPVRTFTIAFGDPDLDESKRAAAVAHHLGTDHKVLEASEGQTLDMVDDLSATYDEPFGDPSALPTMLLARLASEDVTVALTGDGGDELFGGYTRYAAVPQLWNKARVVPAPIRRAAMAGLGQVSPNLWDRLGATRIARSRVSQLGVKVGKIVEVAGAATADDAYHRVVSHWQDPASLVSGASPEPLCPLDGPLEGPEGRFAEAMMDRDLVSYLPNDILTKVDRATMAVGLESRAPFLARAVVEHAVGLPLAKKLYQGKGKWILRQVLGNLVPPRMWESPKQGFGPPIDDWLRGALAEWAEAHVFGAASRSKLNQGELQSRWDEHQKGHRNHGYLLWDVAAFGAWADRRSVRG